MPVRRLRDLGQHSAAGLFEEPNRNLFYRKALGLRRFYETCELPAYGGEYLYPSGPVGAPSYLSGMAWSEEVLEANCPGIAHRIRAEFIRYTPKLPANHNLGGTLYTHSMPHYERVLREGLASYIPRIEKIEDEDMRDGLLHLMAGISTYLERCLDHLTSVHADDKLISALKQVPMHPARDIYEAVVAWNFILYLDGCDNLGCVASGLRPYHRGEDITHLLKNLYDNLDANNGYSMALHTDDNPLTLQCLEASKGKRRPMIELFVDENTPDEVWDKAFEVIRTANGQPAFLNPHILLDGLQRRFPCITDEDIKGFCGGGCTESMIAGRSCVGSLDAGINLLLILEETLKTQLTRADSFEDFYTRYLDAVRAVVDEVVESINRGREERARYNPLPMRTLLVDDCIDKGLDFYNGGARYRWSIVNFSAVINVIDSLLVVRDLVFDRGEYSPEQLLAGLGANDKQLLAKLREHENAFGKDLPEVNAFGRRLSEAVYSMLDDKKLYQGEGFLPAAIQFMTQVRAGWAVGATPDGREAGAPVCDSLAAIFGKDTNGPTALLNSVASLDLERALGVPVLNFNLNPDFRNETLKALILGYMRSGGVQMQVTCISREMLEEAYRNPELHKNLVVRVGGYSEYFCRLSDELKRMVINRTIQQGV